MRRYIILATTLLLAGVANHTAAREVQNINAGWTFFTSDDATTDAAATVNLPHVQHSSGTVNYLKSIDVPTAWRDKRVFLRVGGASRVADLFVGGAHVATHRGGGSAFTVEITDRLVPGAATSVRIVVRNAPSLEVMPIAGREKIYTGLFRGVDIVVCDPLSVSPAASLAADATDGVKGLASGGDGVWISTDKLSTERAEGCVRLGLLTPQAVTEGAFVRVRFADAEGNVAAQSVAPFKGGALDVPFTLSHPRLWQGVEDPYLYNVEVAVIDPAGAVTDSLHIPVGLRTMAMDGSGRFTLNGKPLRLRGVVLGRDRMMVGTALTPFQIEEDVDFILEIGANAVRVAGGQHSDYFYQLCDEAGLVVWNDGPFTGAAYPTDIDFTGTEPFRENGRLQLSEMVSQLYNHPSVVAWGLFSNIAVRTAGPLPYMRELHSMAKELDPARLTAASSVSDGEVNFITDIVSFDLALGWESGLPDGVAEWLKQLKRGWPDLRAGISYAAGGSIFQQSERPERPLPGGLHPEGWQTFFHEQYVRHAVDNPGIWGVFVGNMFDSGTAKSETGAAVGAQVGTRTGDAGIDDRGLVTFDRKDRKDAFWLYKAVWNSSDTFVRIAGSRLDNRSERRQTFHVYSNRAEVELIVNGRSQGVRTGEHGVFVWEDVAMRAGANRVEARADGASPHRTSVNISPAAAQSATRSQPPATTAAGATVTIPVEAVTRTSPTVESAGTGVAPF